MRYKLFGALLLTFLLGFGLSFFARQTKNLAPRFLFCDRAEQTVEAEIDSRTEEAKLASQVVFNLKNPGADTVNILSVDVGCGCLKYSAKPEWIEPGQTCQVTVDSVRGSGYTSVKTIPITLNTNSLTAPQVRLVLTVNFKRQPPYVVTTVGDLIFTDPALNESREFKVRVVDASQSPPRPNVRTNLKCAQIEYVRQRQVSLADSKTEKIIDYVFRLTFHQKIPDEDFGGTVIAEDPYHKDKKHELVVLAKVTPDIHVAPKKILVSPTSDGNYPETVYFVVATKTPGLALKFDTSNNSIFGIREKNQKASGKYHEVELVCPKKKAEASHSFQLKVSDSQGNQTEAPVVVSLKEANNAD